MPICFRGTITKTCLYNFDLLKPPFYMVKLGFSGVYIIFFLFLLKNIDFGYSLEPPQRSGSNDYPQSMFWTEIWKSIRVFLSENFQFLEVKFSIYWNRRVLTSTHNLCFWGFSFSSILQIWYVEVRISRSISESHLEFEITRIDCTCHTKANLLFQLNDKFMAIENVNKMILKCAKSFSTAE